MQKKSGSNYEHLFRYIIVGDMGKYIQLFNNLFN